MTALSEGRTPKIRILYIGGGPQGTQVYGGERTLLQLLGGMDWERFDPCCVVTQGPGPYVDALRELGVRVPALHVPTLRGGCMGHLGSALSSVTSLVRLAHTMRPDMIHVHSLRLNPYGVMISRALRVPLLCYVYGTVTRRAYFTRAAFAADRIVAMSEAIALPWRSFRPSRGLSVVHGGIDCAASRFTECHRMCERMRLGLAHRGFVIGVVSRLSPEKGWTTLFSALASPALRRMEVVTLVAGDAPPHLKSYGDWARQLPLRLGIRERVVFLGYVQPVTPLYSALDVLVLASDEEPFGLVVLEAMAAGKPVIATQAGGPVEIVVDGETGLLVPPREPEALAMAIARLASDSSLCRKMGEAGRKRVLEHFTVDRYVRAMESTYDEMLEERRPRGWRGSRL